MTQEKTEKQQQAPEVEVLLQYRNYEANMEDVVKRVKEQYIHKGNDESTIESMQIYIKPEDFTAYYVINDGFVGKISLF
jgi:hypothetical protein